MSLDLGLWALESLTCSMMCGIVWYVQCCHYPLFHQVAATDFAAYEHSYTTRAGKLIAPIMVLEACAAIAILWRSFTIGFTTTHLTAFALLVAVWLSTFLIQVPLHNRLSITKSSDVINRLLATNWIRTLGWSARSGLLLFNPPHLHHG